MAKLRGSWPRVDSCSTSVSVPIGPMLNTAMLSWPRFEPYRKRPLGCTATSAVELSPEYPAGSDETLPAAASRPEAGSQDKVVIVDVSSLIAKTSGNVGWKAM